MGAEQDWQKEEVFMRRVYAQTKTMATREGWGGNGIGDGGGGCVEGFL